MTTPLHQAGNTADHFEQDPDPRSRLLALKQRADRESSSREREFTRNSGAAPPDSEIAHASRAGPDSGRHCAPESAVSRLLRRWLPESVLRARVDPGRAGRLGLALAAVLALLVVVLTVWVDRPVAEPAPVPPLPVAEASPAPAPPAPPPDLVISVVGEVTRPGLVEVPPGSRVADALAAAGGPRTPDTDITALNLARRLADGEQLYVAVPVPPGAAAGPAPSGPGATPGKVDLNTATEEQLDALPGVGAVTAERIVQWRAQHGRFGSVDQLQDVEGIGEKRMARLRDLVGV
ncbi:helix-hairpin-helix domain-containing protein [Saccharopolyspora sp. MS10]|uniref:helix-hairpin-helix domain-containing protein n=1 Tax=Saccharopolyspora sp. MS10 TaxID=3385973 RepID=UPI0039A1BF33